MPVRADVRVGPVARVALVAAGRVAVRVGPVGPAGWDVPRAQAPAPVLESGVNAGAVPEVGAVAVVALAALAVVGRIAVGAVPGLGAGQESVRPR